MTTASFFVWWRDLSQPLRNALLTDPHGHVPTNLIPELVASGEHVAGAYWVASQEGPDGFSVSSETAKRITEVRDHLEKWWSGLDDDGRATFNANQGKRIPPKYRDSALAAYGLLTTVTAGSAGAAPEESDFRLVPIAEDFVAWKASQK